MRNTQKEKTRQDKADTKLKAIVLAQKVLL